MCLDWNRKVRPFHSLFLSLPAFNQKSAKNLMETKNLFVESIEWYPAESLRERCWGNRMDDQSVSTLDKIKMRARNFRRVPIDYARLITDTCRAGSPGVFS